MYENPVDDFIEITLAHPDDFLKVKETLERIGMPASETKTLYQSCHIFHKRGKLYVVHFKEMFKLDGKPTNITESDIGRRNTICRLLQEWGLIKVVNPTRILEPQVPVRSIKIIPYSQKGSWNLKSKYLVGYR